MNFVPLVLGIDVGGVIIDNDNYGTDTSFFGSNYLKTSRHTASFEVIDRLNRELFGGKSFIVSKAGENTARKTRAWFDHHDFSSITGIPHAHMHFVRERKDKSPIATRLGITHFVDDKLDVLTNMPQVPNRYLFTPKDKDLAKYHANPQGITLVHSWSELARILLPQ